ncbi:MAG TPA: DUF423 domain-containing protein [Vicinamibacterales bacterium]
MTRLSPALLLAAGSILAGLAVAIGAFGAHGLRALVTPERLATFETGVRYHFYHAVAIVLAALVARAWPDAAAPRIASLLFLLGIALFSGSLYLLVLTDTPSWGAVAPFGGIAFLAGWAVLAWSTR